MGKSGEIRCKIMRFLHRRTACRALPHTGLLDLEQHPTPYRNYCKGAALVKRFPLPLTRSDKRCIERNIRCRVRCPCLLRSGGEILHQEEADLHLVPGGAGNLGVTVAIEVAAEDVGRGMRVVNPPVLQGFERKSKGVRPGPCPALAGVAKRGRSATTGRSRFMPSSLS